TVRRLLRLAEALRRLTATVKLQNRETRGDLELATEWLAESYYQQSRSRLTEALGAARKAVERSPEFGFGWARVAELEFSFGRLAEAEAALDRSLKLAPRNAEALTVKGFLLSARNRTAGVIGYF